MKKEEREYSKILIFIGMLFITFHTMSAVLVFKILQFGWFHLPGGVLVFPLCFSIISIITEVYGASICRHIIWCGNVCSIIFSMGIAMLILLPSPNDWEFQNTYLSILGLMPIVLVAGILGSLVGEMMNAYTVHHLKCYMNGKRFWFRSLLSHVFGHAAYTLIAGGIMFISVFPLKKALHIMVSVYLFKIIYSLFVLPLESVVAAKLKKNEGLDVYERNSKFKIFPFSTEVEIKKPDLKIIKN